MDTGSRRNVLKGLVKININRRGKSPISGTKCFPAVVRRMATELDTYVWERLIRSCLKH
jgi:hypothetical protein